MLYFDYVLYVPFFILYYKKRKTNSNMLIQIISFFIYKGVFIGADSQEKNSYINFFYFLQNICLL